MSRKPLKERVKDVVTLKTAKENFFQNDGFIEHWFAHGATELANMNLHGQPAPLYAGHSSPSDQTSIYGEFEAAVPDQALDDKSMGVAKTEMSFLDQTMAEIQQQSEFEEPELEMDQ